MKKNNLKLFTALAVVSATAAMSNTKAYAAETETEPAAYEEAQFEAGNASASDPYTALSNAETAESNAAKDESAAKTDYEKAQKQLDKAEDVYAQADTSAKEAFEDAVTDANKELSDAESVLSDAQADADAKEQAVKDAESDLSEAEKNRDAAIAEKDRVLEEEGAITQKDVTEAETAASDAKDQADAAKKAYEDKQAEVSAAKNAVTDAEAEVTKANEAKTAADQAVSEAQAALDQTQEAYNNASAYKDTEAYAQAKAAYDEAVKAYEQAVQAKDDADAALTNAEDAYQAAKDEYDAAVAAKEAFDKETAELEQKADEAGTALETAKTELSESVKSASDLENKISGLKDKITGLESDIADLNSKLPDAEAKITDAEAKATEAKTAFDDANERASIGLIGFMNWMLEKENLDEKQRADIDRAFMLMEEANAIDIEAYVNKWMYNPDYDHSWVYLENRNGKLICPGDELDATSLTNIAFSILMMKEINEVRRNDEYYPNINDKPLDVNFSTVMYSSIQSMKLALTGYHSASNRGITPDSFCRNENGSFAYRDHGIKGWYDEEKAQFEKIATMLGIDLKNRSVAEGEQIYKYARENGIVLGHYGNLMDPDVEYMGVGVNGYSPYPWFKDRWTNQYQTLAFNAHVNIRNQFWNDSKLPYTYTVEEFESLFNEYLATLDIDNLSAILKNAEAERDAAIEEKENIAGAIAAKGTAKGTASSELTNAETALVDVKKDVEAKEQVVSEKETAVAEANKALTEHKASESDVAKRVTDANAAVNEKQTALEGTQRTADEKGTAVNSTEQSVTAAKIILDGFEEAVREAAANLESAKTVLDEKVSEQETADTVLSEKSEILTNAKQAVADKAAEAETLKQAADASEKAYIQAKAHADALRTSHDRILNAQHAADAMGITVINAKKTLGNAQDAYQKALALVDNRKENVSTLTSKAQRAEKLVYKGLDTETITDPDFNYLNGYLDMLKGSAKAVADAEANLAGKKTAYDNAKKVHTQTLADLAIAQADYMKKTPEGFITRLYSTCLNRKPDKTGMSYWLDALSSGSQTGSQVAYGFLASKEYQNKNRSDADFVEDLYKTFLGRGSDKSGKAYWLGKLEKGASREEIFNGFVGSKEFTNLCNEAGINRGEGVKVPGSGNDAEGFIYRLYKVCLDRKPDKTGLAYWQDALASGQVTATSCAKGFIFSKEFTARNYDNATFIKYLYKSILGREADSAGLKYWEKKMQDGESREQIFTGFAASKEFGMLCEKYKIKR